MYAAAENGALPAASFAQEQNSCVNKSLGGYQSCRKNVSKGAFIEVVRCGRERDVKTERSADCGEFLTKGKTHALIILEAAEKWRMIILERWNGVGSGKQHSGDGTKLENGRQSLGMEQCSRAEDDFGAADGS